MHDVGNFLNLYFSLDRYMHVQKLYSTNYVQLVKYLTDFCSNKALHACLLGLVHALEGQFPWLICTNTIKKRFLQRNLADVGMDQ